VGGGWALDRAVRTPRKWLLKEARTASGSRWGSSATATGSAVIVSVVVLIGSFIPLLGTDLANTWALAVYIIVALLIDVVTALTLLPLMISWIKPKYVFEP